MPHLGDRAPSLERGCFIIPHTGRRSSPSALSSRRNSPTARPKWGFRRPGDGDRSPRTLPEQDAPPIASQSGAPHPIPPPVRVPPQGIPGIGADTRSPQAGRSTALGPGASPPAQSGGVPRPPSPRTPEWNVPVSPPRVPAPLRRSDGSTGPGGGGRRVRAGRTLRRGSGTVTCTGAALRGPGRLRGHGPALGTLRLVRHLQLHGRARGPAGERAAGGWDSRCGRRR